MLSTGIAIGFGIGQAKYQTFVYEAQNVTLPTMNETTASLTSSTVAGTSTVATSVTTTVTSSVNGILIFPGYDGMVKGYPVKLFNIVGGFIKVLQFLS